MLFYRAHNFLHKKPLLRQQERLFIGNTEDGINQTFDLHIVSSSNSYRKQNASSLLAVIFVLIFSATSHIYTKER